ncbi:MAG: hypothetical protein VKJ06_02385 [Vampirovibrionales bacterium]|nr:hypothetical protein [Vampirovibrionales bacterium]
MQLITYPELDSTNAEAKRLIMQGAIAPGCTTLILAETQTAGRGTQGRVWHSPQGGLYMTLVHVSGEALPWLEALHPPASVAMTLAAGIACQQVVSEWLRDRNDPRTIVLKPINDLMLIDDVGVAAKTGGILVETQLSPAGKLGAVMTGVGLNLGVLSAEMRADITQPAAGLGFDEAQDATQSAAFKAQCARQLAGRIEAWYAGLA